MTLTKAIQIALRVMAEHGGLDLAVVGMSPHAQPLNPDNPEQIEIAQAWNTLSAASRTLVRDGY